MAPLRFDWRCWRTSFRSGSMTLHRMFSNPWTSIMLGCVGMYVINITVITICFYVIYYTFVMELR